MGHIFAMIVGLAKMKRHHRQGTQTPQCIQDLKSFCFHGENCINKTANKSNLLKAKKIALLGKAITSEEKSADTIIAQGNAVVLAKYPHQVSFGRKPAIGGDFIR